MTNAGSIRTRLLDVHFKLSSTPTHTHTHTAPTQAHTRTYAPMRMHSFFAAVSVPPGTPSPATPMTLTPSLHHFLSSTGLSRPPVSFLLTMTRIPAEAKATQMPAVTTATTRARSAYPASPHGTRSKPCDPAWSPILNTPSCQTVGAWFVWSRTRSSRQVAN